MKIKFRTASASAMGVFSIGDVIEVEDVFAKPLIDGGFAELLEEEHEPIEVIAEEKPAPKKRKGKKVE